VHASQLAQMIPTVTRSTSALQAAQIDAEHQLAGLIVADEAGVPVAVVPGSQMLKLVVPRYVREDPSLAHVYDESGADELCAALLDKTVADLLDSDDIESRSLPSVLPEDTLMEIAAVMVEARSPLVVVRERSGTYVGAITFAHTMAAIAASAERVRDARSGE
jgi:hypothetical protein